MKDMIRDKFGAIGPCVRPMHTCEIISARSRSTIVRLKARLLLLIKRMYIIYLFHFLRLDK